MIQIKLRIVGGDNMIHPELKYMRQLELRTGEIKLLPVKKEDINIYQYFKVIENLNTTANIYGCCYLATDLALGLLQELTT